ncbi:hypothetical protein SUDANB121_02328 [Nocardiopsis dassonvillei]|uniref:hypothetical protein n=1 Tax=Nocardiopsis dassonvillei TaxID=2014 RepID=UPI003F57DDAB
MSNPTFATKVVTLFKGLFGRKEETAAAPAPAAPAEETAPAAEKAVQEKTAEAPETAPAAEEKAQEPAAEEVSAPAAEVKAEVKAGTVTPGKDGEAAAEPAEEAPAPAAEEKAPEPAAEEKAGEPAAAGEAPEPATADLADSGEAIAEEIAAAEAKTEVADSGILEKVRKDNAPAAEDLAVPTYDELTLPSVRARLRKLTVEQVRDLRAYEVAHQGRAEFIKMYDNRIAKLEDTDS